VGAAAIIRTAEPGSPARPMKAGRHRRTVVCMNTTVARDETTFVTRNICGGAAACGAARALVARLVGETTPEETLQDALLLTSELVTNAVLHGGVGEHDALGLHVTASPELLHISVADRGGATTPEVQELDLTVPGGMGLFIVDQISDRWGVDELRDGGTQVWFELDR
jgi:anti-sigma regulatory factor (Ser/Thr protein kinase)